MHDSGRAIGRATKHHILPIAAQTLGHEFKEMKSRQLEARIKKLCAQALNAEESEIQTVFQELRAALREHNDLMRKLAAEYSLRQPEPRPAPPSHKRKDN
jgi:hypothetical protein